MIEKLEYQEYKKNCLSRIKQLYQNPLWELYYLMWYFILYKFSVMFQQPKLKFEEKYCVLWSVWTEPNFSHSRDYSEVQKQLIFPIDIFHHWSYEFEPVHGKVYSIHQYVIKLVSDLRQVLLFPPPRKLTATILLKYCWKWH